MMGKNRVSSEVDDFFDKAIGEDDNGQGTMFGGEDELQQVANMILGSEMADKFEVKLALVLKPVRDNALPIAIPIARGKVAGQYIEEIIDITINGAHFRNILRAAVGQPSGHLKQELDKAKEREGVTQ